MRTRAAAILGGVLCGVVLGCGQPTGPEREMSGQRLFAQHCARCHGDDGRGAPSQPGVPDLSARVRAMSDERMKGTIRAGRPPGMPGFGDQFSEVGLRVLVAWIRGLSAQDAPEPADPPR